MCTVAVGEAVGVFEGSRKGVDWLSTESACTVSAAIVLTLLTAKSTMLAGSRASGVGALGADKAMAEVMHNKLMPRKPAATTPSRLV